MKYVQRVIPSVDFPEEWEGLGKYDLRNAVQSYMKAHFVGKTIKNEHLLIDIDITVKSCKKTARGEAMYRKKAAVCRILDKLLQYSAYNNFGKRKDDDSPDIIGYLNFKGYCYIDKRKECVRIAVRFQKGGKFYYSIEVNKKNGSTTQRP